MFVAVAALGRVTERQQPALVAARQVLQPCRTVGRIARRLAGQVGYRPTLVARLLALDQPLAVEDSGDPGHRCLDAFRRDFGGRPLVAGGEREVEEAVRVVEARPQRSEENTSALQSLITISFHIFCLKKKNKDPPSK